MPFIKRDENGNICGVKLAVADGYRECLDEELQEVEQFLLHQNSIEEKIAETDLELVRVLEDLIDLLIEKEVIRFTDLPAAAQKKLLNRRDLRAALRPVLNLLGGEIRPVI